MAGFFRYESDGSLTELQLRGRFLGRDGNGDDIYQDIGDEHLEEDDNPPDPEPSLTMLMGCSASNNSHGGTEVWDGWRIYDVTKLYNYANRTGSQHPKFICYSEDVNGSGDNLGGATPNYTTVYNHVRAELDNFYYGGTGTTLTARGDIDLYWSNGNENMDKGALDRPNNPMPPLTATQITNFGISQQALYDAIHYIPTTGPQAGVRRYPRAYAGSNPVHDAERQGRIAEYLHPTAKWHDFVVWSMYPPGRKDTATNPTYNWPSFFEADRTTANGFLIRCYYRTYQANLQARTDTGNPNRSMMIACGEIGIGDDPADTVTRPYYAVYGMAHGMLTLSAQYGLPQPFACWWDNDTGIPNILSDENPATNPSTRQAWQNHLSYNTYRGGTKPASWAGTPKTAWKDSGTPR